MRAKYSRRFNRAIDILVDSFRGFIRDAGSMGLKNKSRTNQLTRDCLILLQAMGYMAWRQNNHASPIKDKTGKVVAFQKKSYGTRNGVPDIIVLCKVYGTFIGLEIKVGKDTLSKDQIEFRDDLLKTKAKYYVITCIDDLMALIDDNKL